MKHDAPERLASSASADPELARALRALRDDPADAATVARVGSRLGPLLDAPASTGTLLSAAGRALGPVLGWKLAAPLLLAMTSAAVWWWSGAGPAPVATPPVAAKASQPAPRAPAPEVATQDVSSSASVQTEASLDVPSPTSTAIEPAAVPAPRAPSTPSESPARPRPAAKRARRPLAARKHAAPRVPLAFARSEAAVAGDAPTSVAGDAPTSVAGDGTDSSAPAVPAAEPVPVKREAPAARPLTEFELLLAARQSLSSDPQASLERLDEHARRFPSGMLAPEREVLAIDALEAVGRSTAAAKRAARFRANYPDSPHLRSLP